MIFCLPPHSTHVAQPLDISFFQPLKVYWSEACHKFMQENPGRVVTKYSFSPLFAEAWYKAIRPGNLIVGFVKVGVCPFNPEAIKIPLIPPGIHIDEGGASGDSVSDGSPGDDPMDANSDPSIDWQGDDRSRDISFTPKQLELFEQRYENGYDLYTDVDYVAWLMECHPEDVPDEILGEMGSNFENARSDPFQPFEKEPSSVNTNICIRKHCLCENVSLLRSNEAGVNLSSSEPSVEQISGSISYYTLETPKSTSTEQSSIMSTALSSSNAPLDHLPTDQPFVVTETPNSTSTEQSSIMSTPLSSSNAPLDHLPTDQPFVVTDTPNSTSTEQSSIVSTPLSSSNAPLDHLPTDQPFVVTETPNSTPTEQSSIMSTPLPSSNAPLDHFSTEQSSVSTKTLNSSTEQLSVMSKTPLSSLSAPLDCFLTEQLSVVSKTPKSSSKAPSITEHSSVEVCTPRS